MRTAAWTLLHRELLEHLRTRQPYFFRAAVLIAVYIAVGSTADFVGDGYFAFLAIMFINFYLIAFSGPILFATTITEEREAHTLELLFLTRLTPFAIALGKAGSRGIAALILLLIQIPIALLAITLGGVSPTNVLCTYGLLALYLFFVANAGLAMSALSLRSRQASVLTALIVFLHAFLGPILGELVAPVGQGGIVSDICESIAAFNNSFALWQASTQLPTEIRIAQIVFHLAAGILFFACACVFLKLRAHSVDTPNKKRRFLKQQRRHPWGWPHAWKDFHLVAGGWRTTIIKSIIYAGIFAVVGIQQSAAGWFSVNHMAETVGIILFWCLILEVSWYLSTFLHSEAKGNTLASIATIPRSLHAIALEKVAGALCGALPVVAGLGVVLLLQLDELDWVMRDTEPLFFALGLGTFYAHLTVFYSLWIGRASPVAAFASSIFVMFFLEIANIRITDTVFVTTGFILLLACIPIHLATVGKLRQLAGT